MLEYFASKSDKECVDTLREKIKAYNLHKEKTGERERADRSCAAYFGKQSGEYGVGSASIGAAGENGEIATLSINKQRTNIKHALSLTVSQKPTFDPKAKNTDLASLQQTRLAANIIDSYMADGKLGRQFTNAAELALVEGYAFVYMFWNTSLGRPYAVNQMQDSQGNPVKKVLYEGEPDAESKSFRDVIHDVDLRSWEKKKWTIVRSYENRWDLASKYPQKQNDIINLGASDEFSDLSNMRRAYSTFSKDTEIISTYEFYHIKTEACSSGRYIKFLSDGTVLYDGEMQYPEIPVYRISPGDVFDSVEGYTEAFDTLAVQQAINVLYSTVFSNQQAFGLQIIHLPDGTEVSATHLKGLAVLSGGPPGSEPKALQLTATPPEIFKNIDMLSMDHAQLLGLNNQVVGKSDPGVTSGIAIGRYQAMAIQFASNYQRSYASLLSACGTFLFKLIKQFAKTERVAALAGKANRGAMVSFTGDDLNLIERVDVDLGNPQARTAAGRIEMADMFYQKGEITAKQYMQVASTGNLDTIFESEESELELIRKENENLMDGKPVRAIVGDRHLHHAKEHKVVINDPMLRDLAAQGDPEAMKVIESALMHIQEHEQLHAGQTPFFGMMSDEPPPPPPTQGPPPMGPEGAPEMQMQPDVQGAEPPPPPPLNPQVPMQ